MNYTIIENPYKDEKTVIATRGVLTDAKIAKLNNDKKRPALTKHWEELKPEVAVPSLDPVVKDYSSLLEKAGITAVNYGVNVTSSGAKKLRVNKIVNEKAQNVYNSSDKVDIIPEKPKVEIKEEVKIASATIEAPAQSTNDDIRGRHEKTAQIPVNEVKETIKNIEQPSTPSYSSRSERASLSDILSKPEAKQESKAGDMDLYNNLLHNASVGDDVSRQLQGARNQLSIEQEENRKLAEQYGEAVKELAKLKEEVEVSKKQKEQKVKEELSITLKSIENLQKENLERTSDLTSIKSEIARLKAEKQAMDAMNYE